MQLSAMAQKIIPIIEPSIEAMGYSLVRVQWQDGATRSLQIMIERRDGREIAVEDCTEVSHTVSALLDVEDPIDAAYNLEVSSPGIDRPLTKMEHFKEYAGEEAKIEMAVPQAGRKRFRGTLSGTEGELVKVLVDGTEYSLPYAEMQSAKLVLTDALMKKALKKQTDSSSLTQGQEMEINE